MLGAILTGAKLLGGILGGGGAGKAEERQAENERISRDNATRASLYGTQQNALQNLLGLQERGIQDRAQMGVAAPSARMKQALLASLIQNARPSTISGVPAGINVPRVSSPLSAIDAATRGGGGELQRQALLALLTKSDVPAATDYAKTGMLTPPQLAAYKKAGALETLLSTGGLLGGILGAVGSMKKKPTVADTTPNMGIGAF